MKIDLALLLPNVFFTNPVTETVYTSASDGANQLMDLLDKSKVIKVVICPESAVISTE